LKKIVAAGSRIMKFLKNQFFCLPVVYAGKWQQSIEVFKN
jgi:hypothetical protein